jgi:hypothetical protein
LELNKLISIIGRLPYGADSNEEKWVARVAMGGGALLMATGSAFFAVAWSFKFSRLLDTAFVLTLVGWMLLIVSFAFWFVASIAKKVANKRKNTP